MAGGNYRIMDVPGDRTLCSLLSGATAQDRAAAIREVRRVALAAGLEPALLQRLDSALRCGLNDLLPDRLSKCKIDVTCDADNLSVALAQETSLIPRPAKTEGHESEIAGAIAMADEVLSNEELGEIVLRFKLRREGFIPEDDEFVPEDEA